jgi:hypothetical protein
MKPLKLIIIYTIIAGIAIGLFFGAYFTVSCKISLSENEVIQGNNVDLYYEIDNKLLLDDIHDVEFSYWVEHSGNIVVSKEIVEIPLISRLNSYKSGVEVDTSSLDKGKYTIWTQTTYSIGKGGAGVGNRESKLLSLDFYII